MTERGIKPCADRFLPAPARPAARGGGAWRALLGSFPSAGDPRAAAGSWSHRVGPPAPRCPPPDVLPRKNHHPPQRVPAPRHRCHPGPRHSSPALETHPAGLPRSSHPSPLGAGNGLLHAAPIRRIPGKAAPPPAPRPGKPALPPTCVRVPGSWRSGRRPLGLPVGRIGDPSRGAGRLRVPAPALDFLPGGPIVFFVESSQAPARVALAHLLASETSIHCPESAFIFPSIEQTLASAHQMPARQLGTWRAQGLGLRSPRWPHVVLST